MPTAERIEQRIPVVSVAGTCMNAGKTVAATELVRGLSRAGLRVAAAKLTGVSLMRDALSMQDAGAVAALTFNDVGIATTHPGVTVASAKGIFNRLAAARPDVVRPGEAQTPDVRRVDVGERAVAGFGLRQAVGQPLVAGVGRTAQRLVVHPAGRGPLLGGHRDRNRDSANDYRGKSGNHEATKIHPFVAFVV